MILYTKSIKKYKTGGTIKKYQEGKEIVSTPAKQSKEEIEKSRTSTILGLMDQGIKDPKQILNLVNYKEDGTKVGDFTLEEVKEKMKAKKVK